MATTSATLLEGVRDLRDEESWERFVQSYRPLILMYVRAMGAPTRDVQDICQMVIVKLVSRMPDFRYDKSKGSFRGYLRQVVRTQAAEHHRKNSAAVPVSTFYDDSAPASIHSEDPWETMWMRHHYAVAWARVRSASTAGYVQVYELVMRGLSSTQIASHCSMSDSSVRSIKRRMEQRLRAAIQSQVSFENSCLDSPDADRTDHA